MQIVTEQKYILQHVYTLQYVTRTKKGKRAEFTFTDSKEAATVFTNNEAALIIGATAKVTETDVLEILTGIEVA